jgi:hypothetical protein
LHAKDLLAGAGFVELPLRPRAQVPQRSQIVAVSVGTPGSANLCRPHQRTAPPAPSPPDRRAEGGPSGSAARGHPETGWLPHLPPLCRVPDYAECKATSRAVLGFQLE